MTELTPAAVRKGFERARERRQPWEPLWRECYAYALPQRGIGLGSEFAPARRYADGLFDGTAPDAVEQLAASLLAELTPPWSQWFGFRPGHDVGPDERVAVGGYPEWASHCEDLLFGLALRRADAEIRAERATWDAGPDEPPKPVRRQADGEGEAEVAPAEPAGESMLAPVERLGQDLADRERIRGLLDDEERLVATFRVYVLGGLEPVPTWLQGDLVELVGPGVAAVAIERARGLDTDPAFAGYYDALAAEVALAQGDDARALAQVELALRGLPSSEVLLRARVAAVGARAAADAGDEAASRRYLATVMQLDPGTLRRQGLAIPAVIRNTSSGPIGAEVAARLRSSPRLREESGGFEVRIEGEARRLRICVSSPEGAELSCTEVDLTDARNPPATGTNADADAEGAGSPGAGGGDAPQGEPWTDAQVVARTLQAFHDRAFGFGLELSAVDLRSLDGTTVVSEEAARERMQAVLEQVSDG